MRVKCKRKVKMAKKYHNLVMIARILFDNEN